MKEQQEQSHQKRMEQLDRQKTLVDQRYGDGVGAEPEEAAQTASAQPESPEQEQAQGEPEADGREA